MKVLCKNKNTFFKLIDTSVVNATENEYRKKNASFWTVTISSDTPSSWLHDHFSFQQIIVQVNNTRWTGSTMYLYVWTRFMDNHASQPLHHDAASVSSSAYVSRSSWHPPHSHISVRSRSGVYLWTGVKTVICCLTDKNGRLAYEDWR